MWKKINETINHNLSKYSKEVQKEVQDETRIGGKISSVNFNETEFFT